MRKVKIDKDRVTSADDISAFFQLTASEAVVCRALCQGYSAEQIADSRNVAVSTVRQQVKACLNKTGASSKAQLVALVLTKTMS